MWIRLLGVLDDKIELNQRMNKTLDALVSALFGVHFTTTSAGVAVHDLVHLCRASLDPQESPDELFDHYSIPAFDKGRRPVVEAGAAIKSTKLEVPTDSLLLSKLNPRFPRLWLPDLGGERRSICSTEFLVCVPREPANRPFLYGLFFSRRFRNELAALVTGTSGSHQRVKPADFLALEAPLASRARIEAFSAIAHPLLERMLHNIRESQTVAKLRDTLLPKLISGTGRFTIS